ncbi:glycosyl transferase family 2 [Vreelandella alkaliphila]|uniref:glycosyltransferase family 2 protein n=1 Tax=Vreelandella alkaliphila TaxID=272774 RepID=UPI000EA29FA7|nr:glycosyltransferase family 2 protein [Halomonas alkaliphila]AYF34612.1 glycosyl transferase family 2 [Halomonas alkaliphila]
MTTAANMQIVMGKLFFQRVLAPEKNVVWDPYHHRWEALNESMEFSTQQTIYLPGWYMIELMVDRSVTSVAASFRFEAGKRTFNIDMPLRVGKLSKRLVHVPWGVKRITFRPMNAKGHFSITHFRLVWVSPAFARDRLLQRLINIHQDYRDITPQEASDIVRQRAKVRGESWRRTAIREYESTYISLCSRRNYRLWVREFEGKPVAKENCTSLQERQLVGEYHFYIPVAETHQVGSIERTLTSLQDQLIDNWKAVLLLAADCAEDVRHYLDRLAVEDPRITVLGKQAAPLSSSLSSSTWVAILRPGDQLAKHALYTLAGYAEAELLYSDEDELDADGMRHSPLFKPQWNPDLLLSQPYVGSAIWVRGDKLAQLMPSGGLPCDGAVGSWKATLALNVLSQKIEKIEKIEHVGRILFHGASSLALQPSEDYASIVRQNFAERRCLAQVTPGRVANSARVMWPVPSPQPLVSLLVPTRDSVEILKPCVDAILERTDYRHFELLILDNQSSCAKTLAYMDEVEQRDARVKVLRWNHEFNYSAINNFGAKHSNGDIIGLINNDVEPIDGEWLTEMVSQASRPEVGCVGAKLYYPNGTVQHGGVILGLGGVAGHAHRFFQQDEEGYAGRLQLVQNLTAVTAACLLLRREVFEKVGGLNEVDLTVAYNDVDLCLKVHELGLRNLWTPYAELYHHESISRGADDTPKKRARALKEARYMRKQWGPLLDSDPAYNSNLTLAHEDFSLR